MDTTDHKLMLVALIAVFKEDHEMQQSMEEGNDPLAKIRWEVAMERRHLTDSKLAEFVSETGYNEKVEPVMFVTGLFQIAHEVGLTDIEALKYYIDRKAQGAYDMGIKEGKDMMRLFISGMSGEGNVGLG